MTLFDLPVTGGDARSSYEKALALTQPNRSGNSCENGFASWTKKSEAAVDFRSRERLSDSRR
jgi:hypothetical protein